MGRAAPGMGGEGNEVVAGDVRRFGAGLGKEEQFGAGNEQDRTPRSNCLKIFIKPCPRSTIYGIDYTISTPLKTVNIFSAVVFTKHPWT